MASKNAFKTSLTGELGRIGYLPLPLDKGAYAMFFKKSGDLFLTLGCETSRTTKESFTGSFYLAPAFSWSYAPPEEFPEKAYSRIGEFLTPKERKEIDPSATAKQVDVWWKGFTPENAEGFAAAVAMAEKRLLQTKGLAGEARKAPAMMELLEHLQAVTEEVKKKGKLASKALEKVKRETAVPESWYAAAAKVAAERFKDYNHKDGIKMLAEEAWLLKEFGG